MSGAEDTRILDALASAAGVTSQEHIEHIKQGLTQIVLEPAPENPIAISDQDGEQDDGHSSYSGSSHSHPLTPPIWTHRVSASFSAMAEQIAAASKAIASIPPLPDTMFAQLSARMDDIERTQERIEAELGQLRDAIGKITEVPEKFQKGLDDHVAAFKLE